jgi:hypothetical protein
MTIELGEQITVRRPSGVVRAIVRDLDERFVYFAEPTAPSSRTLGTTAISAEGTSWLRGWDDDAGATLEATQALSSATWDLHTANAAALFDIPPDGVTPSHREDAKRFVMGPGSYGGSMKDIAKAVGVPLANVKRAFAQMVFPS